MTSMHLSRKPIKDQIRLIAKAFALDPAPALQLSGSLPSLPEGAELWLAFPRAQAVLRKAEIEKPIASHVLATRLAADVFRKRCASIYLSIPESDIGHRIVFEEHTADALRKLERIQAGSDIFLLPAQLGTRDVDTGLSFWAKFCLYSHENEFGLTGLMGLSALLSYPERISNARAKPMHCPGDRLKTVMSTPVEDLTMVASFSHDGLELCYSRVYLREIFNRQGVATGFLPKEWTVV